MRCPSHEHNNDRSGEHGRKSGSGARSASLLEFWSAEPVSKNCERYISHEMYQNMEKKL